MDEEVPPQPKLTKSRKKVEITPEPEVQAIPPKEVKKRAPRKKPEPGTVPPKEVSFASKRGAVNFTAHKEPEQYRYANLHSHDCFSAIMRQW